MPWHKWRNPVLFTDNKVLTSIIYLLHTSSYNDIVHEIKLCSSKKQTRKVERIQSVPYQIGPKLDHIILSLHHTCNVDCKLGQPAGASSTCIGRCINASWSKQGGNEIHRKYVKSR